MQITILFQKLRFLFVPVLTSFVISFFLMQFNRTFGTEIQALTASYIIPLGGIIIGAIISISYIPRLIRSDIKVDFWVYLIVFILAIFTFGDIYYFDEALQNIHIPSGYFTTFIGESNYSKLTSFWSTIDSKESVLARQRKIFFIPTSGRYSSRTSTDASKTLLNFLACPISAIVFAAKIRGKQRYSDKTSKYYKQKILAVFKLEDFRKLSKEFILAIEKYDLIENIIKSNEINQITDDKFLVFVLDYCPGDEGYMILKPNDPKGLELTISEYKFKISEEISQKLFEYVDENQIVTVNEVEIEDTNI